MNAAQRRTAYRKIEALAGKAIEFTLKNGAVRKGVILGLTKPTIELPSKHGGLTCFNGNRPSVHRIRVRLESKATMSPLLSRIKLV